MLTIEDLGRMVKIENPDYADISDAELGRVVKMQSDGAYDDFIDLPEYKTGVTDLIPYEKKFLEPKTEAKLQTLYDYYNPHNGVFSSWLKRRKVEAQNRLLQKINENQELVIQSVLMYQKAVRENKMQESDFRVYIMQNQLALQEIRHEANLIEHALQKGLTVDADQKQKSEIFSANLLLQNDMYRSKLWIEEEEKIHRFELEKKRQESQIKLNEYRFKAESDLDIEVKVAEAKLNFAIRAKHISRYMKIGLIQDEIEKQYTKISEIRASTTIPADAKDDMIASRQRIIDKWVKEQDETEE